MSLLTLMYHSVSRTRASNLFTVEMRRFADHLSWLKRMGHQPVTLSQIADWLEGRRALPHRALLITFDDGYLDNFEVALPLLQQFQTTACIFITTGWCGDGERYHTQLGERQCPMLTWTELKQLADMGVEIGAHSVTHPFLTQVDSESAWNEIQRAKLEIESRLEREVHAFSYPNSRHNLTIREMVRQAGYRLAFGGDLGMNHRDTDRYNLRRACVYSYHSLPEFTLSICTGVDVRTRYRNWRRQHHFSVKRRGGMHLE